MAALASWDVLRTDDLLALHFEFTNLTLQTTAGTPPALVREQPSQPAFIIAHFAPQHLAEAAFEENADGTLANPSDPPVDAVLAGPSRLAFRLRDDVISVPFTLPGLLDWTIVEPLLSGNALPASATEGPPPTDPARQRPPVTGIELPYRIVLSPDAQSGWKHATAAVTHNGRTELWHTRLGARQADGSVNETGDSAVRAIWSPDLSPSGPGALLQPFTLAPIAIDPNERRQIVQLSSDFSLPIGIERSRLLGGKLVLRNYVPQPMRVERLMLTALGGWLRLDSKWNFPEVIDDAAIHEFFPNAQIPLIDLAEWRHIATGGRDQYVRLIERGCLFPFGNRAILVTITERKFKTAPGGDLVAYLSQRQFVVVQEPDKDYESLAAAYAVGTSTTPSAGRQMPLKHIHITSLVTPNLHQPLAEILPSSQVPPAPGGDACWITVDGQSGLEEPFPFHIVAEDVEQRASEFTAAMIFVRSFAFHDPTKIAAIRTAYTAATDRRQSRVDNQTITFAPNTPDQPGATHLKTSLLSFQAAVDGNGLLPDQLPATHPRYLPFVDSANVSIPAIDHLLGAAAQPTTIAFHATYLEHEFDATNAGGVFATITDNAPAALANTPAEKSGGLATPRMNVNGLSRSLGPVPAVEQTVNGTFDPNVVFGPLDANLLGVVKLAELLDPSGTVNGQIPTLTPIVRSDAVGAHLEWKPKLKQFGVPPLDTSRATLAIVSETIRPLGGAESTFHVDGDLANFAIDFLGVMRVSFDLLKFRARKGEKLDVSAGQVDVTFEPPLEFVNTLRHYLPSNGFSDPPSLTVTPEGVAAGYSLGLPSIGIGVFSLENIALSASLSLPFVSKPAGIRFAFCEREHPFLVSVALFGGGGFFALAGNTHSIQQIEASIEFGGNISLDLGVASGGVHVMAGVYFNLVGSDAKLTGFLRCGGFVEVLGIVSISIEFYLGFTYETNPGDVWGQATLTVCVRVAFFSKSLSLSVERRFAGGKGDPSFIDLVAEPDWEQYMLAFA